MPVTLRLSLRLFVLIFLCSSTADAQLRGGDVWGVVRGDNSPGFSYSTFVETPSGRWLAAGNGGALMYSDNEGVDWSYDVITDDTGRPIFGNISDMVVHNGRLVATLVSFRQSIGETGIGGPPLPFIGATKILTSTDNGNSWTIQDFPVPAAVFEGPLANVSVPGIWLPHLFVTPGGELLAYGTTAQSTGANALFLGGVVFRNQGSIWTQVAFKLGVLQSMSVGGAGELIATGYNTLLESEDGSFWDGYDTLDANFVLNGQPLNFEEKDLLNGSDIAFINGKYVLQTQQFRRSTNNPQIVVASNQRSVIFESDDPFAPTRDWTGTQVSRIWPRWLDMGSTLLSLVDGAWLSGNGINWSNVDSTVQPLALSYGRVDAQGVVAVGNGDEVWKSGDAGQSWDKILDQDPGSSINIIAKVNDVLLGRGKGVNTAQDSLYRSVDNGTTWVEAIEIADIAQSTSLGVPAVFDGSLYVTAGFSDRILVSRDTGFTWDELMVPSTSSQGIGSVVVGNGGRLIAPQATFSPNIWVSDNDGDTWDVRASPLGFGDNLKRGIHIGGGRIIYLLNGFASFNPRLLTSNDNGSTWQIEDPFQSIDELDRVSNDPDQRVINLRKIYQTASDRLIILGDDGELLLSRDRGQSWEVKLFLERLEDDFLDWNIFELLESEGRLIAIASRNSPVSSAFSVNFAYISEDDGESWRPVEIPTSESRIRFTSGVLGAEGRLIITGGNGAVYTSESTFAESQAIRVREAESITIDVPRPPSTGEVTVTYRLLPDSASAGTDFVQTMGELTWLEGESEPKQVTVETVDDPFNEGDETLRIAFGASGDLIYSWSYEVTIADDELQVALPTAVDIEVDGAVRTSENGESVTFGVALWSTPSQDVTIELSVNDEAEIAFEPATLIFTPDNFKRVQDVTVTGLDDQQLDGNRTVELTFTTVSAGPEYDRFAPGIAYVINEDNEVPVTIFNDGFEL